MICQKDLETTLYSVDVECWSLSEQKFKMGSKEFYEILLFFIPMFLHQKITIPYGHTTCSVINKEHGQLKFVVHTSRVF